MELKKNDLVWEERVISTINFLDENEDITEIRQSEFAFTDGLEENIMSNDIEEIEILKDEVTINKNEFTMKENEQKSISQNFKEYIILCRELELIPSWMDFERYNKF